MKKIHTIALAFAASFIFAGCATQSDYVDASNTQIAVKNKHRMSSSDWVVASEQMGADMLSSFEFTEFLTAYKMDADEMIKTQTAAGKKFSAREKLGIYKPNLYLSEIQNNTSEHIDTKLITNRLREVLFKSGKVRITTAYAGAGQVRDDASHQARNLKYDPAADRSSHVKQRGIKGYDLSLGGAIIKQTARDGRANELSYTFSLTLTDNSTGQGVWTKVIEIKRQHLQGGFGW